jgi:hypothetical protein
MQWIEFAPYILPYAGGCPEPLLELHTRLAAIDFCRRTLCDTRTLDPIQGFDQNVVELDLPPETVIVKIKAVEVDTRDRAIVSPAMGRSYVRSKHPGEFCFTPDNRNLHIYPAPTETVFVVPDVALMPSLQATGLLDEIANEYMHDIAHGALARILMVPNQTFSDPNSAVVHANAFKARVNTIAAKIGRGIANSKTQSFIGYI